MVCDVSVRDNYPSSWIIKVSRQLLFLMHDVEAFTITLLSSRNHTGSATDIIHVHVYDFSVIYEYVSPVC